MKTVYTFLNKIKKNPIIRGTLILTTASIITRIIGFFFRIFLSRTIGAEGIGIYQLIFPIQLLCYSLCTYGFELAISRLVAIHQKTPHASLRILKCGVILSVSISLIVAYIIYQKHSWIANRILFERRCEPLILWMSFSIPLASIHACICGYYLGLKKAFVPAWSQFIEQCTRVLSICIIVEVFTEQNIPITAEIAVIGSFIGEIFSVLFTIFFVSGADKKNSITGIKDITYYIKPILHLSIPVTLNRVMLSVMQSIQSVLIPFCLMEYGLSSSESLSLYGICLGLVIPLILFPSAFIHSVCAMLLPAIAEVQNKREQLYHTTLSSTRFSVLYGLYCSILFVTFGNELGTILFHNAQSGVYIRILGMLCPFLYLTSTFASILNGLGKTSTTFGFSIVSTLLQLCCTILLIPKISILGYLIGMLTSSIVNTGLHYYATQKQLKKKLYVCSELTVPITIMLLFSTIIYYCNSHVIVIKNIGMTSVLLQFSLLIIEVGILTCVFLYTFYWSQKQKKDK